MFLNVWNRYVSRKIIVTCSQRYLINLYHQTTVGTLEKNILMRWELKNILTYFKVVFKLLKSPWITKGYCHLYLLFSNIKTLNKGRNSVKEPPLCVDFFFFFTYFKIVFKLLTSTWIAKGYKQLYPLLSNITTLNKGCNSGKQPPHVLKVSKNIKTF